MREPPEDIRQLLRGIGVRAAILGTAVSLTFVITLDRWNALAAAIALLVGAVVWFVSTKR